MKNNQGISLNDYISPIVGTLLKQFEQLLEISFLKQAVKEIDSIISIITCTETWIILPSFIL